MQAPNTSSAARPVPEVTQTFNGGMRDRDHPSMLDPNQYAYGKDIEVRDAGLANTRRGRTKVVGPIDGIPQGAVYYEYSAGQGKVVFAAGGKVYQWGGAGTSWERIGTLQLNNTTEPIQFAILNGTLFMFSDGTDNARSWNGTDSEMTDLGDGANKAPRGDIVTTQNGRIVASGVSASGDYIYYSDIFDGTAWNRSTQTTRIPTPRGEPVTGLAMYRKQEILVFTKNTSHIIDISGSDTTKFTRSTLDPMVGCVAPLSIAVVGDDAFFVSADRQLRTIKRTINDAAFAVSMPVSYLVPNLFDRITRGSESKCAGVYFNNYYLLAAPLDGRTMNTGVIAFDMLHQTAAPAGQVPICVGEWTNMAPLTWVITNFNSKQMLHYIDSRDGTMYQMFAGETDDYDSVSSRIDFRAPSWQSPNNDKTMRDAELQFIDTIGTVSISYCKEDGIFLPLLTVEIGQSSSARLDTSGTILPFNLAVGGILKNLPLSFYRRGRSRYWQLRLDHTAGKMNLKQMTQRAWVEESKTR